MTLPIQRLGLLVSSAMAIAALAAASAWAGDGYGPADGRSGGYASSDYGYQGAEQGGWDAQSSQSRSEYDHRASETRRFDDVEEVDPCAMQHRLTGRGCEDRDVHGDRGARYGRGGEDRGGDIEAVDPCAAQYRMTGRGCEVGGGARYFRDQESSERRYDRVDRAAAYDRMGDEDGFVDACVVAHERRGERCPYQSSTPVVWVEERLPDSFFFADGSVGGGVVDYGGGGGGGGGFGFGEGFSSANADASSSASASASVSVAIAMRNHHMMPHYPQKMPHGGGCGCGSGGGGGKKY